MHINTYITYSINSTPFKGEGGQYFYLYRILNLANVKEYVGVHHTDNLDDGYSGPGSILNKAKKKYGLGIFFKIIEEFFYNSEAMYKREEEIVTEEYVNREDTYNQILGDQNAPCFFGEKNGFFGKHHTKESLAKIKNTRIKNGNFYRKHTAEEKRKLSESSKKMWVRWRVEGYTPPKKKGFKVNVKGVVVETIEEALKITEMGRERFIRACGDPSVDIWFIDEEYQKKAEEKFKEFIKNQAIYKIKRSENCRELAKRINKDPDKIRKTAEAHRGMKRSAEARLKMSLKKKGKKTFSFGRFGAFDTEGKMHYVDLDFDLPPGWRWSVRAESLKNENQNLDGL